MMPIEITATSNEFSKNLFNINSIEISDEASQLKSQLDEIALERLLHSEPLDGKRSPSNDIVDDSKRLSKSVHDEYRNAFVLFDKNGDGKVTESELHRIMRTLGQYIKLAELREILHQYHAEDQYFSFEQFVRILSLPTDSRQTSEELARTFRVFDKRNTGYINASDLRNVWLSFDICLTNDEIDQMIKEVDVDGDGRINFDEFVGAFMLEENDDQKPSDNCES